MMRHIYKLLVALQVKPDLVLMGKQAIDGDNCQTG
jgi:electron transfer flavoprotein alpha/beta subunit